jgi:tRNA pseudouridine13 synthase
MFIHAYQSFQFNRIISERFKTIGFEPVKGDILEDGIPTAPLFGYECLLAKGKPGEIERQVLGELKPEDFKIKSYPELSSRGLRKPILVKVKDFEIIETTKGKIVLRFTLPKSAYATNLLREFMKNY